jgi:hypothetical protein
MQCVAFNEFGQVVSATTENCVYVLVESGDFLASASLDAVAIAQSFSWGFTAVISIWVLSYYVRAGIKTIKLM